jgi:hypothetical protein
MPLSRLILPLGAPLTVSAAVLDQLDRRPGTEFSFGAVGRRDRSSACRHGGQSNRARECRDNFRISVSIAQRRLEMYWNRCGPVTILALSFSLTRAPGSM